MLRMKFVGANPAPQVSGIDQLPGKSNYFIGNDPAKWRTNVANYAKVKYQEMYPGVDLVMYGNQRQLEYDFVVAPGADPKSIQIVFEGARQMRVEDGGDLVLRRCVIRNGNDSGVWARYNGKALLEDCEISDNAHACICSCKNSKVRAVRCRITVTRATTRPSRPKSRIGGLIIPRKCTCGCTLRSPTTGRAGLMSRYVIGL